MSVLRESSGFAVKEGGFEGDKRKIPTSNLSSSLQHEPLENDSAKVSDLGKHPNGVGLAWPNSTIGFETYCYGVGAEAGDGVTPDTDNAFGLFVGAALGGDLNPKEGDIIKTATTPTTTALKTTDSGVRAAPGFVAWKKTSTGETFVRPVASASGEDVTTLLAFPEAPTAEDVLPGLIDIIGSEDTPVILQGDLLMRNATDVADAALMYEYFGAVCNLTLPETAAQAAQKVNWEMRVARFTQDNDKPRTAPATKRPTVAAGGEFLIAKRGNTAGSKLAHLNLGVTVGRAYTGDPAANDDIGIDDWIVTGQDLIVTVTVKDNQPLPAGFTATKWHQVFKEGTENLFHLLAVFGNKRAGGIFGLYFPCLQLEREPEPVDVEGLQALKLTFSAVSGLNDDHKVWACLV